MTTAPSPGEKWSDLVTSFIDNALPNYLQLVSNNWFVESFAVVEMFTETIVEEVGVGLSATGAATGDAMPPQIGGIISWRTGRTGRRGKGRTFLPPTSEGNSNSTGVVSGPYLDAMDLFAGDLESFGSNVGDNGGVYIFAIMSEADSSFHAVTSHVSRNKWGTQRGRAR
jgi:hypothetical protein